MSTASLTPRAVVSITSRVSNGAVGNSLIESAFLRLAPHHPLLTIDTVSWTAPGNHPRRTGVELAGEELTRQLAVLTDARERLGGGATLILAGYLRTSDQAGALASFLKGPGRGRFDMILDPVLGDGGRLYVPISTAEAIRDRVVPHARILLPNLTEASWLVTGDAAGALAGLEPLEPRLRRYAESHGVVLVVKSIPVGADRLGLRVYRPGVQPVGFDHPRVPLDSIGTGDLFAGIVAAGLAAGRDVEMCAREGASLVQQALELELQTPRGLRHQFHSLPLGTV